MEIGPLPPFDLATIIIDAALPLPELLRSVERQIARAPVEVSFAFDETGKLLCAKVGEVNRIAYTPAESDAMRASYYTHNHPSGNFISLRDLDFAHAHNVWQLRAVTPTHVFILFRPATGWNSAALWKLINRETYRKKQKNNEQALTPHQIQRLNARLVQLAVRTLLLQIDVEPL